MMTKIISLAGSWSCRLDPGFEGIQRAWYKGVSAEHEVLLPGTTQTNGVGPKYSKKLIGNLTPSTEYIGSAWYWREFEIGEEDLGGCIDLHLERVGWESFVWLNGIEIGSQDSLISTHRYDLSSAIRKGENHLCIMADNSNLKEKGGGAADKMAEDEELVIERKKESRLHCGGHHASFGGPCWNGITGKIDLVVKPKVHLGRPQVYPDIPHKKVKVLCPILNSTREEEQVKLSLKIEDDQLEKTLNILPGEKVFSLEMDLRAPQRLWDEHSPELYSVSVELESEHGRDLQVGDFGIRDLSSIDNQIALNGRKVFLRGALEKLVHPLTGHPPTDREYWLKIFKVHRDHGLNHLRFHSCCPPKAAFEAADRLGLILNVELPGGTGGESDDELTQQFLQDEALRILEEFGNHPSFCMLTMGNEVLDDEISQKDGMERLNERVRRCREADPRRWYCCTANAYTPGRKDDFYVTAWPNGATAKERHRGEPLRGFRWNGGDVVDDTRFNTRPPETVSDYGEGIVGIDKPVITHEVGMWAVYPDISEIPRFGGVMKPFNLEIIRDFMKKKGTLDDAQEYVKASGELSLILYKEEIEAALRTRGLSGLQLLGIHDHPPQGTSTIGVVTALREPKGIIHPQDFRQFCSETVPLARLSKRTFVSTENLQAHVEIAHYGPADIKEASVSWVVRSDQGEGLLSGHFPVQDFPTGALSVVGEVVIDLGNFKTPSKFRLEVFIEGTSTKNGWDFWVVEPKGNDEASEVHWAKVWDEDLADRVEGGETVVLELGEESIPHGIRGCFTTLLWNPIMKRKHLSQTMGLLCDPSHPVFSEFPTDFYTNWQWWDIIQPSRVMNLDGLEPRPDLLVRMVDSFIGNRHLSPLFELKMGKGKMIITSFNLGDDLDCRHSARQLRKSLLKYAGSLEFEPKVRLVREDVTGLIEKHRQKTHIPSRVEINEYFDIPVEN